MKIFQNQNFLYLIFFCCFTIISIFVIDFFGKNKEILNVNNKEIIKNDSINKLLHKDDSIIIFNQKTIIKNEKSIIDNQTKIIQNQKSILKKLK